jgi:hypothetical protein
MRQCWPSWCALGSDIIGGDRALLAVFIVAVVAVVTDAAVRDRGAAPSTASRFVRGRGSGRPPAGRGVASTQRGERRRRGGGCGMRVAVEAWLYR